MSSFKIHPFTGGFTKVMFKCVYMDSSFRTIGIPLDYAMNRSGHFITLNGPVQPRDNFTPGGRWVPSQNISSGLIAWRFSLQVIILFLPFGTLLKFYIGILVYTMQCIFQPLHIFNGASNVRFSSVVVNPQ